MTEDDFVSEITRRAWRFGVAVAILPQKHVQAGPLRCSGYFDPSEQPVIAVARGNPMWLGILAHEYCHLTQWAENSQYWQADRDQPWVDWLSGKDVPNVRKAILATRDLEEDCERRAIRLMMECEAPVDLELYARGANAYIHFHNVMAKKRKWFAPGRAPYAVEEVLQAANPTLDADFSKTPKHLFDAIAACLQ